MSEAKETASFSQELQDKAEGEKVASIADAQTLPQRYMASDHQAAHDIGLAVNCFGATGMRRHARLEATKALLAEGFATVDDARAAVSTLGAQIWCAAVLEGMRSKNPTIRRTAMQSFERAARIGGSDGALIQTFVLQFGLGSLDDVRAILDHARSSRELPPEQVDRDCVEWLEARGYRVSPPARQLKP